MTQNLVELPDRIVSTLRNADLDKHFFCAIKTTVKPNDTIPTLWLTCTERYLLLCNTHRTRGIFRKYAWSSVNEVRRASGSRVEIIHNDLKLDDEVFPIDSAVTSTEIGDLLDYCKSKIDSERSKTLSL